MACIHRLPPELLVEIAFVCYTSIGGQRPWQLNQVSRALRNAINNAKSLWTTILITERRSSCFLFRSSIPCYYGEHLQCILGRSFPLPIDLIIETNLNSDIYDLLLEHSHRIKSFDISCRIIDRNVWQRGSFNLERLERLGLSYFQGGFLSDLTPYIMTMVTASSQPCLKVVATFPSNQVLEDIMRHPLMRKVTTLSLTVVQMRNQPDHHERILMPKLESLSLLGNAAASYYPDLKARNLRSLTLGADWTFSLQHQLLPRTLQILKLSDLVIGTGKTISSLMELPNLKYLTLLRVSISHKPSIPRFGLKVLKELTISRLTVQANELALRQSIVEEMFGRVPSLNRLWINEAEWAIFRTLDCFPQLRALRLTRSSLFLPRFETILKNVQELQALEELSFGSLQVAEKYKEVTERVGAIRPGLRMFNLSEDEQDSLYPFKKRLAPYEWDQQISPRSSLDFSELEESEEEGPGDI